MTGGNLGLTLDRKGASRKAPIVALSESLQVLGSTSRPALLVLLLDYADSEPVTVGVGRQQWTISTRTTSAKSLPPTVKRRESLRWVCSFQGSSLFLRLKTAKLASLSALSS